MADPKVTSWADESPTEQELNARVEALNVKSPGSGSENGKKGETDKKEVKKEDTKDAPQTDEEAISLTKPKVDGGIVDWGKEIKVEQADPNSPLYSVNDFKQLNLKPKLLEGIYAMKFTKPSRIQETALPMILNDPPTHLVAQSQSGTGKTAAFTLGLLSRIDESKNTPQALVLSPTRELARQTSEVIEEMGKFMGVKVAQAVAGSGLERKGTQAEEQAVVGTAGSLADWLKFRTFDPKNIKVFVVDEADEMLRIQGQKDKCVKIRKFMPKNVQLLLFSATFPEDVSSFTDVMINKQPRNLITLERSELTVKGIKQYQIICKTEEEKYSVLENIYGLVSIGQVIIFCRMVRTVDYLSDRLTKDGHAVSKIYGKNMDNAERDRIIDDFRSAKTKVLLTTNVLARGIDILQVNVVINYDPPTDVNGSPDYETYLHRIGRTGRFGHRGVAINFVHSPDDKRVVRDLEKYFGIAIKEVPADDDEALEGMLQI
eukprot:Clim_evm32s203 gene=Clim_evmTU32s203